MIVDFLLTGALFLVLLVMIFSDTHSTLFWDYNYWGERYLYYASVPVGYSMVLHARCWWRRGQGRHLSSSSSRLAFVAMLVKVVVQWSHGLLLLQQNIGKDGFYAPESAKIGRACCPMVSLTGQCILAYWDQRPFRNGPDLFHRRGGD